MTNEKFFTWVNASFLKTVFHRVLFQNRAVMSALGFKMPPLNKLEPYGHHYADLTTLLLARTLRRLVEEKGIGRAHEIGVGPYATLAIYLKRRFPGLELTASTVQLGEIRSALEVARQNGCRIECAHSDVLDNVDGQFGLIWWNLPYYDPQVAAYVDRLFRQIGEKSALAPGGLVVLGFNSVPLKLQAVVALVGRYSYLSVYEVKTFRWNPQVILTLRYVCPSGANGEQRGPGGAQVPDEGAR